MSVFCLALGAFAIGTEGFVIAGLLPSIATDLSISVSAAGQLVTAYALTYAVGSPILAVTLCKRDLPLGASRAGRSIRPRSRAPTPSRSTA